jgi:hypothetical protein
MSEIIVASSLNELNLKSLQILRNFGKDVTTRTLDTKELLFQDLCLTFPRNRHIYLFGRKGNIYATFAEILWVYSGSALIKPYLAFFLPRALQYSDDGKRWRGAYSSRLYNGDQISGVVETLEKDLLSRQAVITLWDAAKDSKVMTPESKDYPCNNWMQFIVRDNLLRMKVVLRSNDALFGFQINVPEWTFLQECMYHWIHEMYPEVELGDYLHSVTSFHYYKSLEDRVFAILADTNNFALTQQPTKPVIPPRYTDFQLFNASLVHYVSKIIEMKEMKSLGDIVDVWNNIEKIFRDHEVPVTENQYYDYVLSVLLYAIGTKFGDDILKQFIIACSIEPIIKNFSLDWKYALVGSDFSLTIIKEIIRNYGE